MPPPTPKVTLGQVKAHQVLHRMKMEWVMLIWIATVFTIALAAFIVALFAGMNWVATTILGAIDGTLGAALLTIIRSLFPSSPSPAKL
jgi:hypothetical protein